MDIEKISESIVILSEYGIQFKQGMMDSDFKIAEEIYNIKFPKEYKDLLRIVLPYDDIPDDDGYTLSFTDWKNTSNKYIESIKNWTTYSTMGGIIYTIEKLDGWCNSWGYKPTNKIEQIEIAKIKCSEKPLFIPVVNGRFIALTENLSDSSVYSIHQGTDVVPYGYDIWDFIKRSFKNSSFPKININKMKEPMNMFNIFVSHSEKNFKFK